MSDRDQREDGAHPTAPPSGPTRRQFLGGLTTGAAVVGAVTQAGCGPAVPPLKTLGATGTTTVCPFCGVGCGQVVSTKNAGVLNIEGDPTHPINEGTLCPKGANAFQLAVNPHRVTQVLYRAPYADHWETRSLDWALDRIAERVKAVRDADFTKRDEDGRLLNSVRSIGTLGGATIDNEENYLIKKLFAGGLGVISIENQARI